MKNKDFFEKVYAVVRQIPHGRVTTYGAIARYLGSGKSARVVGWALNQSFHTGTFIPAHRVVNRKGMLTGKHYFGFEDTMKQLLENEDIEVINDQVVRFRELFWDPAENLNK
ncbi:MAG TPA: MGMT family protein [Bacteroidetes bacterium]|nr:MGMT family protein [Bacteroidota bacterium]